MEAAKRASSTESSSRHHTLAGLRFFAARQGAIPARFAAPGSSPFKPSTSPAQVLNTGSAPQAYARPPLTTRCPTP